ncbi:TniQ family protein [Shewanella sp. C32]|uniref:TniQ family protein n=1 Tax=Shewanella electrica TaxID=515560 RepID=A0ABT2FIA5_9GAMM|nr:TniQ family protein [Shewanella electrica]MCH1924167.1 TniQ family protein [Shewanella electrica]MCS4556070.1 TniQ family protein [Shewanella electrica]
MSFLFSPEQSALFDETLESYLLRVTECNSFASYRQLSLAIRDELYAQDYQAHGAFPLELSQLNVIYAQTSSHFRVRALALVASLLGLQPAELLKLALLRLDVRLLGKYAAISHTATAIPASFVRENNQDSAIPICPECLAEAPYIRQNWHFQPYQACTKHHVELIDHCPKCSMTLNYVWNESITHCSCGFDLSTAMAPKASNEQLQLSGCFDASEPQRLPGVLSSVSVSERLSALLWFDKRYSRSLFDAVNYFEDWPSQLYRELDEITANAEQYMLDVFNRTAFSKVYGDIIITAANFDSNSRVNSFIYCAVMSYFAAFTERFPRSKTPNQADLLLSIAETAAVLNTSIEQVYRLLEDGVLVSAKRLVSRQKIEPHVGLFYLRQVFELRTSFGSMDGVYMSSW